MGEKAREGRLRNSEFWIERRETAKDEATF
jgi:hypothetical protein